MFEVNVIVGGVFFMGFVVSCLSFWVFCCCFSDSVVGVVGLGVFLMFVFLRGICCFV